jgi:hypothetical protein
MAENPDDGIALLPNEHRFHIGVFQPIAEGRPEPDARRSEEYVDLMSMSIEHHLQTVAGSLELGARHIDVGQRRRRVMWCSPTSKDEFCVTEPGISLLS